MCQLVLTRQFIYGNHAALLNRMLRHRQTLNNVTHRQSANNFVVNLDDPFLLPDLKLPEQPKVEIGIWGRGSPVETSAAGKSADRADRRDSV